MIPLRDDNPSSTLPVVTRTLIAINAGVFLFEVMLGPLLRPFVHDFGLVPLRLTLALRYHEGEIAPAVGTVFSSMFMHGGWSHLIGNMWYLWIFGDNVEDRLGHRRFLVFYVAAGTMAALFHYLTNPASEIPTVGASGAVAGVLGAYVLAFPHARVITLVPLFPFFQIVALPAFVLLGLWFLFQFVTGVGSLGSSGTGGIAWWAHIGGFAFGWLAMRIVGVRPGSRAWVER